MQKLVHWERREMYTNLHELETKMEDLKAIFLLKMCLAAVTKQDGDQFSVSWTLVNAADKKYWVFFCILTCSTTLFSILVKVWNVNVISVYISINCCSLEIYNVVWFTSAYVFYSSSPKFGTFFAPPGIYDIKCSLTLVTICTCIQAFKKHNNRRPSVVLPRKWKEDIDDVAIDSREICAVQRNNSLRRTHTHTVASLGETTHDDTIQGVRPE